MSMVNGIVGSVAGGALGALAWTIVGVISDYEIGWIAWGVGALAGAGMSLGLKGAGDVAAGVVAALIAVVSVFGGKYAAVHFAVQRSIGEFEAEPIGADLLRMRLADEVVEEWTSAGRELSWPEGMTVQLAQEEADYPPGVWDEAEVRFAALSPEENSRLTAEMTERRSSALRSMQADIAAAGFQESLGPYDLLWAGLAVVTAFKLASRTKETQQPTAPAA